MNIFSKKIQKNSYVVLFVLFITLSNSIASKAQTAITIYSETYYTTLASYESFKDSMPFYLIPYGLGGANANSSEIKEEIMLARANVIDLPVLITTEQEKPFIIWKKALLLDDTISSKPAPKLTKEQNLLTEKSSRPAFTPEEIERQKSDSLKLAQTEIREQKNQTKSKTKDTKKPVKQSVSVADTNNNKSSISPSLYSQLPLSLRSRIKEMGTDKGIEWLYGQQLIAGNVLFCNAKSYLPIAVGFSNENEFTLYKNVIKYWKSKFTFIWKYSTLEELKIFSQPNWEDLGLSVGKNSISNTPNFDLHNSIYLKELQKVNP